jgi:hypothetical protein
MLDFSIRTFCKSGVGDDRIGSALVKAIPNLLEVAADARGEPPSDLLTDPELG